MLDYYGDDEFLLVPRDVFIVAPHAFENINTKVIYFENYINVIQQNAFYNCPELIMIYIPENSHLEYISEGAFVNCPKLKYISDFSSEKYKCISNTIYRIEDEENYETIIVHAPMSRDTHFEINSRIIGESSFMDSYNLETVFINSNTVRTINRYAFFNCTNLKRINFPLCVSSVYEFSFEQCYSLEECLDIENHLHSFIIILRRSGLPYHCIRCINIIDDQTLIIPISHLKTKISLISLLQCRK